MRSIITPRFTTPAATLAVAALILTAPTTARAQQTYYTDLASFETVAPASTLYGFNNIAPLASYAWNPAVLTVAAPGRVTFSVTGGIDPSVNAMSSAYAGGYFSMNYTGTVQAGRSADEELATTTISLDDVYTAFAIEIGQVDHRTNNYTIGLYDGNTQIGTNLVTSTVGTPFFYGVTSSIAFDNIRVTTNYGDGGFTLFDNARTGSAIAIVVPEAGTAALLLPTLGIIGTVLVRRRTVK